MINRAKSLLPYHDNSEVQENGLKVADEHISKSSRAGSRKSLADAEGIMTDSSDSSALSFVASPPFASSTQASIFLGREKCILSSTNTAFNEHDGIIVGKDYWEPSAPIEIPVDHAHPVEWRTFSPSSYSSSIMDGMISSPPHERTSHRASATAVSHIGNNNPSERASRYEKSINVQPPNNVDDDEEFGEDTEHIDFAALKGRLHVFRPGPDVDITASKGKYVFYSLRTGLLRHHVLSEIGNLQGVGVKNLSEIMRSGPFWLDICDPTREELRALCEIFKMHPLTLEGLESEGEDIREKCDVFEKYYFVCIRAFDADSNSDYYMRPINLYMLVSPSCVVTIHRDPLEFSHTIAKRMRLLTARIGLASDWIVYTILEDVLEMFVPSIRATELEIDSIDDSVGVSDKSMPQYPSQGEIFSRIASARKRVTQLIRLMSAKSELLRVIAKRCGMRFSDDALLYLRDLQDHTAMVDQTLHHYDESLNRSHANYLAHINIEISETSNKMSDIMKKLTAISTVTLPWSMITGLMGMNIFVPGGKSYYTESWLPWLCLFIAMASASILIYCIGRRRDWF